MASRISHKSLRSWRSLSRLTLKRAMGIAADARIERIATVTINSTSVRPRSERLRISRFRPDRKALICSMLLLHNDRGLRGLCLQRLARAAHCAGTRNADVALTLRRRLKCKDADHACPAHA